MVSTEYKFLSLLILCILNSGLWHHYTYFVSIWVSDEYIFLRYVPYKQNTLRFIFLINLSLCLQWMTLNSSRILWLPKYLFWYLLFYIAIIFHGFYLYLFSPWVYLSEKSFFPSVLIILIASITIFHIIIVSSSCWVCWWFCIN